MAKLTVSKSGEIPKSQNKFNSLFFLTSYERLKKILLAKYRHGLRIFVKIIRAKIDKDNKNRAPEKKRSLSSFIYSIRQHLIADHGLN